MKYYILKCSINSDDLNEENYGVMLLHDDNSREYVYNISKNIDDVAFLVSKMNEFHIDPCHMKAIIEDFEYDEFIDGHT